MSGHYYVYAYWDGPDGITPGLTYYPRSEEAAVTLAEMLALDQAGAVAMHYPNGLTGVRGQERVLAAFGRVPDNYAGQTLEPFQKHPTLSQAKDGNAQDHDDHSIHMQRVAIDLRDDAEAMKAAKNLARRLRRAIVVTNADTGERWEIPCIDGPEN